MLCVNCGALTPDDSNYCNKCGNPFITEPIDQAESPPQFFSQRFQPFQDRSHDSRKYQPDREPEPHSAYTRAWADGISILESDTDSRQKLGGWFKNLKNSIFPKSAAAPIALEFNQYVLSGADFKRQSFEKEARRSKPRYYSAGNRTYERKR